jgi:hypothetical protein
MIAEDLMEILIDDRSCCYSSDFKERMKYKPFVE